MEIVVLAIAGGVVAAFMYMSTFGEDRRARLRLSSEEPTPIADFANGAVGRIIGYLEYADEHIISPYTGRTCAHFDAIEEEFDDDVDSPGWRVCGRDSDAVDFIIVDNTGRALISAQHIELALDYDARMKSAEQAPEGAASPDTRFREGALSAGEVVTVLGHGTWHDDTAYDPHQPGTYREQPRKRRVLRISGTHTKPVFVSDDITSLEIKTRAQLEGVSPTTQTRSVPRSAKSQRAISRTSPPHLVDNQAREASSGRQLPAGENETFRPKTCRKGRNDS